MASLGAPESAGVEQDRGQTKSPTHRRLQSQTGSAANLWESSPRRRTLRDIAGGSILDATELWMRAALPHRAERARRQHIACSSGLPADEPGTRRRARHWHGTVITNIWERCSSGYRKSLADQRQGAATGSAATGRAGQPLAQASADDLRRASRHEPSLG
jgi:hypothetical protein